MGEDPDLCSPRALLLRGFRVGAQALGLVLVMFFLPLACLVHNDRGISRPTLSANAAPPAAKLFLPRASKVQVRLTDLLHR